LNTLLGLENATTHFLKTKGTDFRSVRQTIATIISVALLSGISACGGGGSGPPSNDGSSEFKIDSFTTSADKLPIGGGNVALSWQAPGAESLRINNGVGDVTGSSINVPVKRNTKFILTATKGDSIATASVVVQVDAAPLTYTIDPSVKPDGTINDKDGNAVPLAASQDDRGVKSTFVANEVIVSTTDPAVLDAFLKRYNGKVVGDDAVPLPPSELGIQLKPEELKPTFYTVQVDPSAVSLDDFVANAKIRGLGGAFKFSSDTAAKLTALATAERAAGRTVALNFTSQPDAVLNRTAECDNKVATCVSDLFTDSVFQQTGNKSDVIGAWQFIAGRSARRRVRVAILDGGFWINSATGQPNTLAGIGHDYPTIAGQYDFDAKSNVVGAASPTLCSAGSQCLWHGNGAASVAFGVVNNGRAAAGTGGQVADAMLFHLGLTKAKQAWAIRTATAWGADAISMSFGGACNEDCKDSKAEYPLLIAVERARQAKVVLVAAGGNAGENVDAVGQEPCTLDTVICVGALADVANTRFNNGWTSAFGSSVDIFAPTNILAVYAGTGVPTGLTRFNGTSASTPFIAGIVAMIKAVQPSLTGDQVRDVLRATAWKDSPDATVPNYVNALAAVRKASENALLPDALEAIGSSLIQGRVDDLSIHSPTDRDEYHFTVTTPVFLDSTYDSATRLSVLGVNLRRLSGCGAPGIPSQGRFAFDDRNYFYYVNYLPPGEYSFNFRALDPNSLAAYSLNWLLSPIAPRTPIVDLYEPNNTLAMATRLVDGTGGSVSLNPAADVDYYRVQGKALQRRDKFLMSAYLSIPSTDIPLRLTLLTSAGVDTGLFVESDPNCREPLGMTFPDNQEYVVKVESVSGFTGNYEIGMGSGIFGITEGFVPHAPIRWEIKQGQPIESFLTENAIDHIFVTNGQATSVQLLGQGIDISLYDSDGNLLQKGGPIPGADGNFLSLPQEQEIYFIELNYIGADANSGDAGRLPGLPYKLIVN
jgi:Subtilase family